MCVGVDFHLQCQNKTNGSSQSTHQLLTLMVEEKIEERCDQNADRKKECVRSPTKPMNKCLDTNVCETCVRMML